MIAELHGKISGTGSNLSDRMEDQLTGDFFGAMRYLPYDSGLKKILLHCTANQSEAREIILESCSSTWDEKIAFWPNHEKGELDAFVEFDKVVIGIEVKYNSGISSDGEVDNSQLDEDKEKQRSFHQLSREAEVVSIKCGTGRKGLLLFVASQKDCRDVYDDFRRRKLEQFGVTLGHVSWESILDEVKSLKVRVEDPFHKVVLGDIEKLLKRKGFERFRDMSLNAPCFISPDDHFVFQGVGKPSFDFSFAEQLVITGGCYYEYR